MSRTLTPNAAFPVGRLLFGAGLLVVSEQLTSMWPGAVRGGSAVAGGTLPVAESR
jgi:hypothetical protein